MKKEHYSGKCLKFCNIKISKFINKKNQHIGGATLRDKIHYYSNLQASYTLKEAKIKFEEAWKEIIEMF